MFIISVVRCYSIFIFTLLHREMLLAIFFSSLQRAYKRNLTFTTVYGIDTANIFTNIIPFLCVRIYNFFTCKSTESSVRLTVARLPVDFSCVRFFSVSPIQQQKPARCGIYCHLSLCVHRPNATMPT